MFRTLPALPHTHFPGFDYSPRISSPLSSSPLSPRDGNLPTRDFIMTSPTPPSKREIENEKIPYSKRIGKTNPLIHNRGDGREARRGLFLKRVRQSSEDRKWEARGGDDEMMRKVWLAEEKRRQERQRRDAERVPSSQEEEAEAEPEQIESQAIHGDDEMVDEVAQQEDAELEAYLTMLENEKIETTQELDAMPDTPYGSDDEDYDGLFMEVIAANRDQFGNNHVAPIFTREQTDMDMDMS